MNSNDKFLLLFSLFFFMGFLFFGLLISNITRKNEAASTSVMYSSQAASAGVTTQAMGISCYLDETFGKMMDEQGMGADRATVVAEGILGDGTKLSVYERRDDGSFMIATQGKGANGVSQNCRVLTGTGFKATQ